MPKAAKPADNGTGGLNMGGGFSASTVIIPPVHADAQPWPLGMVITPPDPNDAMNILPGTDGLPAGERREPPEWGKRFADAIHGGIGAIVDLVLPEAL